MKILSLYTQLINKLQEYYVGHPNHDLTEELLKDARKELSDFNSEDNVVVISLKNYNELLFSLLDNPNTTSEQLEDLYYKFGWASARYKIFRHPNFSDKLFEIYKEDPETEFFTTLNQKQLREADEIAGLTPSKPSTTT
jgi:hypothetical protein